eukprot:scaffold139899_cov15-Tisochrysis_lutea.AAC.2
MHEAESSKKRKEKTAQAKKAVRKQRGEPFGKCNWRFQASGALDAFVGFASFARTEARWKVQEADVCCVSLGVAVQGNAKGKEQQPFSPKKRTKGIISLPSGVYAPGLPSRWDSCLSSAVCCGAGLKGAERMGCNGSVGAA